LAIEGTTDAATADSKSTHAPNLSKGNNAIATSVDDSKAKSSSMEIDGAEGVQRSANVDEDAADNETAGEDGEATATNQDEHDDHIVEGEEDTVIY
jgi:hypothetical protein